MCKCYKDCITGNIYEIASRVGYLAANVKGRMYMIPQWTDNTYGYDWQWHLLSVLFSLEPMYVLKLFSGEHLELPERDKVQNVSFILTDIQKTLRLWNCHLLTPSSSASSSVNICDGLLTFWRSSSASLLLISLWKNGCCNKYKKTGFKISQYHVQVNVLIANNKKYYVIFMQISMRAWRLHLNF